MKKIIILVLIALNACSENEPLNIGWIGPLSGDVASVGTANLEGAQLAVDKINSEGGIKGKKINLLVEDDKYLNERSVAAYRKLTQVQNAKAVLMVTYGGVMSVAPIADQDKTVAINSLDASDELAKAGEFVFGIGAYDEGIGKVMAEQALALSKRRAGLLYLNEDPYPILVATGFEQNFENKGEVVQTEVYSFGETDFRSRLLKIKNARIDVLVVIGYDEAGLAFKQAQELGINVTFLTADTISSENFQANGGSSLEGAYFPFWEAAQSPEYASFKQEYVQKFGKEPSLELYTVTGYDAMLALGQALQEEDLAKAMYDLKNFKGVAGNINMEPDGMVRTITLAPYRYVNDTFKKLA